MKNPATRRPVDGHAVFLNRNRLLEFPIQELLEPENLGVGNLPLRFVFGGMFGGVDHRRIVTDRVHKNTKPLPGLV